MRRRELFQSAVMAVASSCPLGTVAQSRQNPALIAFLGQQSLDHGEQYSKSFVTGLKELGYLEGRDFLLETRFAGGDTSRLLMLATELVHLQPTVLVAATSAAALAAYQATDTIPIVANLGNPMNMGVAKSEARPGRNVTGTRFVIEGLIGKQVNLAVEMIPELRKAGLLVNRDNPVHASLREEGMVAAALLGVRAVVVEVSTRDELDTAFQTFQREGVGIIVVLLDSMFLSHRRQIAAVALVARLPTLFGFREHVESGGLVSYGG